MTKAIIIYLSLSFVAVITGTYMIEVLKTPIIFICGVLVSPSLFYIFDRIEGKK